MQINRVTRLASPSFSSTVFFFLGVLLLLAGSTTSAIAQYTGPTKQAIAIAKPGIIVDVRFEGNHNISDGELSGVIATHKQDALNKILYAVSFSLAGEGKQYTDPITLERDTQSIVAYYRDNGFISARASYAINPETKSLDNYIEVDRKNQALARASQQPYPDLYDTVVFYVDEGKPSNISGYAFEGLENLPAEFQPELTEHTTIKLNTRYNLRAIDSEMARLRGILEENGYPYFASDTIVVELQQNNDVHVLMYFRPGHRYRYGNVNIVYDTATREKSHVRESVVRAQLLFEKGHWYKTSEALRSEQKLSQLGTFDIARVTLDTSALASIPDSLRDSAEVPVLVFLRMRTKAEITPGIFGGSGVDGLTAGLTVAYSNRNFLGGAEQLGLSGSFQPFPSTSKRYNGSVDFNSPYFFHVRNLPFIASFSFSDLERTNQLRQQLFTIRAGTNYPLGDELKRKYISGDITIEKVDTKFFDSTLLDKFQNVADEQLTSPHYNTIFSASLQQDLTDNVFNPTKGNFWNILTEVSTSVLGKIAGLPGADYAKGVVQYKQFLDESVNGTSVLAGRIRVGYARLFNENREAVPYDRRFYAGGPNSVRGWGAKELFVSYHQGSKAYDLVGGFKLFEANAEWRFAPFQYPLEVTSTQKLLAALRAVVFIDAGQTWDYDINPNFKNIGLAIGTGVRYNLFFGPLRFDWGFKLYDPNPHFQTTRRSAAPESGGLWLWQRKFAHDAWAFSFSIGQAF